MKILRMKQILEVTGCSKSFIYKHIRSGNFPGQIKLGPRAVGWNQNEIEEWINSRERVQQ